MHKPELTIPIMFIILTKGSVCKRVFVLRLHLWDVCKYILRNFNGITRRITWRRRNRSQPLRMRPVHQHTAVLINLNKLCGEEITKRCLFRFKIPRLARCLGPWGLSPRTNGTAQTSLLSIAVNNTSHKPKWRRGGLENSHALWDVFKINYGW